MARDADVTYRPMRLALVAMDGPVVWGRRDCCTAACDVFAALTGVDPMLPLRGRYASAIEAGRIVRQAGGFRALAGRLAAVAGLALVPVAAGGLALSRPGLALGPERRALLVCLGPGAWAAKGSDGMVLLDNAAVEVAWNVA
jgi:hypothetical protein